MSLVAPCQPFALYEQKALSDLTGGMLRPGGVELTARAIELSGLPPGSTILDLGCGPGHTLTLLAGCFQLRPVGLDSSASMLRQAASANPKVPLMQAEAMAIPVRDAGFDGVISECVLSLSGDLPKTLQEMARILLPGGKLVLTDIFSRETGGLENSAVPVVRSCVTSALPLEIITAAVEAAGFSILVLEDQSASLKQLAGQIIFSYGSLETFWQLFMGQEEARETCCALQGARPGYYLLIAEKKED
jgi:SAM-dependent methyltransferase